MALRQTRNISLPPQQDAFIEGLVSGGRYRTASEVVRHGLRLLEAAEHRRLLEKWIFEGLTEGERDRMPPAILDRARARFREIADTALREGAASLKVFLEMCEEDGVEPRRRYSAYLSRG